MRRASDGSIARAGACVASGLFVRLETNALRLRAQSKALYCSFGGFTLHEQSPK